MGHIFGHRAYDENCDRNLVYDEICEEAENEGDGYCGPLHWHDEVKPLRNREEAERWISEHDNGHYDDHAVRFYAYSNVTRTRAIEDLERRIKELSDKSKAYAEAHSVKNFKAAFVGCPKCLSKVARGYVRYDKCPVCGEDLRSKTTLDTLSGYEQKRKELSKRLKEEEEKHSDKTVMWLVKYEFHC